MNFQTLFLALVGCIFVLATRSFQVSTPNPDNHSGLAVEGETHQPLTPREFAVKREALKDAVRKLSTLSVDELKATITRNTGLTSEQIDQLAEDFSEEFQA